MNHDELRKRYTDIALAECRKEINRDQRQEKLKQLQAEAFAAGVSREDLKKIADDGIRIAMGIIDGAYVPPSVTMTGAVDLQLAKLLREDAKDEAELAAEEAHWEAVNEHLIEVMATSGLTAGGLRSATLGALLDVLVGDGGELDDVKQSIIDTVKRLRVSWQTGEET